jgi:hypothetical protein
MKKLTYYQFRTKPQEHSSPKAKIGNTKLYNTKRISYDAEEYITNQLLAREENEHFNAKQKIPSYPINFYDFSAKDYTNDLDDFMHTVEINPSFGFFVSQQTKDFLSKFILPNHAYYPVKVHFLKEHDYFFLLLAKDDQPINYNKSIFSNWLDTKSIITVSSYHDLLEFKPSTETSKAFYRKKDIEEQKIVFNKAPDIYSVVTSAGAFLYFSEQLKTAILEAGLTGCDFVLEEKLDFYLEDKN